MFRKILAVMLSVTMMCAAVPAAASANFQTQETETNPNIAVEDMSMDIQEPVEEFRTGQAQGTDLESGNNISFDIIAPEENEEDNRVIEENDPDSEEIANSAKANSIGDMSDVSSTGEINTDNSLSVYSNEEKLSASSKVNLEFNEQSYTCSLGDTIDIEAHCTYLKSEGIDLKEASWTLDKDAISFESVWVIITTPDPDDEYEWHGFAIEATPNKVGTYEITLTVPSNKGTYSAKTTLTVVNPPSQFGSGVLSNVDTSSRHLTIDGVTYPVADECDLSNALNVMKNSDSKKVVYSMVAGKVDKICSIYDVLTPSVLISASPDSILYQNGSYNNSSINVNLYIGCQRSTTSPFSEYALSKIKGLSLTLQEFELKSKSNLLNFGETDFLSLDIMSQSKEGIEVGYLGNYEDSFTVYTNTSKVPNKVSTQVELSSKVKLEGKKSDVISNSVYITVGNLDKQQEQAKKKSETSNYGQYINQASGTLKGMSNAFQFSNKKWFSNEQEKAINEFVNVWMSELILAKYIDKSDFKSEISEKASDKLLKKLGIDKDLITISNTIKATTYLETKTSDKAKVFLQFDINLSCYSFGKDGFPTMASGSGTVTIYDTKGKELDSSVISPAYANVCAFTKQLQEVVKSTIFNGTKAAEKTIVGDEKIAEALSSKTMGKILNAGYEKEIFDMTTSKDLKKALDELFKKGLKVCNDKILKLTIDSSINYIEKTSKVSVRCPVDVNIYDSDGNLCGVVADNTVDSTYDDVIINVNNGDQKNIYFTGDDYSFELIGTNEGTMNYEVSEIDSTGNVVREIKYENVKLSDGCKYYSYVPEAGNYSSVLFDLVDDNGNIILPTAGADENEPEIPDPSIARGQCGEQVYWKLFDDGLLYIYGSGKMYNYNTSDNLPPWKSSDIQTEIKTLSIDNGVTNVGPCACYQLTDLKNVILPNSLTSIDMYAFEYCTSLSEIALPESLTSIKWGAFSECTSLDRITLPEGLTSIGMYAFSECTSLDRITLPEGLASISMYAFSECTSLSKIILPDSLTSIGYGVFKNCENLSEITLPDNLTSINDQVFDGCKNLSEITLPDSLMSIGDGAFRSCNSLNNIIFPDSLMSIGREAFISCTSLNNIVLPDGLTSIGGRAFNGCLNLREIILPNSLTFIGSGAFQFCRNLSEIILPDSLTSIGESTFGSCSSLSNIILSDSLTSIGKEAFIFCTSLNNIVLPDGLTFIGERAFNGCGDLKEIILPSSLTSIGKDAFCFCSSLSEITLPDSLTSIDENVFYDCKSLSNITLPDGLTSIGKSAFWNCINLSEITLPEGLTSIGEGAFDSCNKLTRVTVLSNSCKIGDDPGTISDSAAIYGYSGSTAQQYAEKYNRKFVALDDKDKETPTPMNSPTGTITPAPTTTGAAGQPSTPGSGGSQTPSSPSDGTGSLTPTNSPSPSISPKPSVSPEPSTSPEPAPTSAPGTTTDTTVKEDGTIVTTITTVSPDGTQEQEVVEEKPDGSRTETATVTNPDGSSRTAQTEKAADGSVIKTTDTEKAADGSAAKTERTTKTNSKGTQVKVETVTKTDAAGSVTDVTEESTFTLEDNIEAAVTVTKDGGENVLAAKASVVSTSGSRIILGADVAEQITEAAGRDDVTITITAKKDNGDIAYQMTLNASSLKSGEDLYVYAYNKKTKEYAMVNAKIYRMAQSGLAISLKDNRSNEIYRLVNSRKSNSITKAILKKVKPAKAFISLKKGEKAKMALSAKFNPVNVKKIQYTTSKKSVASVNKTGRIIAKKKGTANIRAKITLLNGKVKTVKMKVKVK